MSKIEWTDATWSPVIGCSKVSIGCQNCWAEKMAFLLACMGKEGYCYVTTREGKWSGKTYHLRNNVLEIPLHWKKPRRIFVCSMGDLFHKDVPFEFIDKIEDVIRQTPQHTYQILTKRPERMYEYARDINFEWPDNIIGMVTAENQKCATERTSYLLQCGFKTTGISVEPLLSRMDFAVGYNIRGQLVSMLDYIDWVIIGCESLQGRAGRFQKEFNDAAVEIVRQCKEVGVAPFVKQVPYKGKVLKRNPDGTYPEGWLKELQIQEMPK